MWSSACYAIRRLNAAIFTKLKKLLAGSRSPLPGNEVDSDEMGALVINPLPTWLSLHSRQGVQIKNFLDRGDITPSLEQAVRRYVDQFPDEGHRPSTHSVKYNCHGLSFAARRSRIDDAPEVLQVIREDGYEQINEHDVLPGDIVIYFESGDTAHSGIVVGVNELKVPIVLSKWGACQEVIHRLGKCPYKIDDVRYYRIRQ